MEAPVIDTWRLGSDVLPTLDEASVSEARERVRRESEELGLSMNTAASLAIVVSELAHNHLIHARGGLIATRPIERDGVSGLEIVAADRGDGILDPERALRGGGSTGSGLGIGLAGVRGLADEVDIDVRLGEGTCVWARKFDEPVRRRREVGAIGRRLDGERFCGDHAAFVRLEEALVLAAADGLGHGLPACEASHRAIELVLDAPERALQDTLLEGHEALQRTRGAVMGLARIEEPSGRCSMATVGNVSTYVCGPGVFERYSGSSAALGLPGKPPKIRTELVELRPWDIVFQFSDGISARAHLKGEDSLLREHAVVIAQHLIRTFATDKDDVLVQVAR